MTLKVGDRVTAVGNIGLFRPRVPQDSEIPMSYAICEKTWASPPRAPGQRPRGTPWVSSALVGPGKVSRHQGTSYGHKYR